MEDSKALKLLSAPCEEVSLQYNILINLFHCLLSCKKSKFILILNPYYLPQFLPICFSCFLEKIFLSSTSLGQAAMNPPTQDFSSPGATCPVPSNIYHIMTGPTGLKIHVFHSNVISSLHV